MNRSTWKMAVVVLLTSGLVTFAADKAKNLLKDPGKPDSWRLEQHEQAKGTMKADQDEAATDCGQKIRRTVDRPRQDRRQDHEEDAVENGSPGKRSARAHANHYQRKNEYDHSAD